MAPNRLRDTPPSTPSYPNWVGFIFIFNLIVGTGALTLPGVFAKAGWLLSLLVLIMLAAISYMTVTFVIEALACANAIRHWQDLQVLRQSSIIENETEDNDVMASLLPRYRDSYDYGDDNDDVDRDGDGDEDDDNSEQNVGANSGADVDVDVIMPGTMSHRRSNAVVILRETEEQPLYAYGSALHYRLDQKFELGEMAVLFFNDIGRMLFYLCMVVYLYGDLSIYLAAVAKSLRNVVCHAPNASTVVLLSLPGDESMSNTSTACWPDHTLTRFEVYRLFLIAFIVLLGPFAAFSVQKTKYLQILTATYRFSAFTLMISLAIKFILTDGVQGHPRVANFYELPSLFGACVYSFMCHHSLPSLLAPIRDKMKLGKLISWDFLIICLFYLVLALTGIFAFDHLEDLYTLNFIPVDSSDVSFAVELLRIIDYFLALFPVFTLSTSFPIIAITLRNNLQTLFLDMTRPESYNYFVRRILFPMCAVLPPFCVTYFTESLTSLVAFTGSYAGACIQYLIPISIVYFARRTCKELLGNGVVNDFRSPFQSTGWLVFVFVWALACMSLVSINFFH